MLLTLYILTEKAEKSNMFKKKKKSTVNAEQGRVTVSTILEILAVKLKASKVTGKGANLNLSKVSHNASDAI